MGMYARNAGRNGEKMMNDNLRNLLRAVADNDTKKAKQYAELICDSDSSQANKAFCNSIIMRLRATTLNLLEVPANISGQLLVEDIQQTFIADRYYLTEREEKIAERVEAMYKASQKLTEMGISYLNSLMLYGKSGTGKTMFGRYMAYRLGLPFAYLNFSHLVDSLLGGTGKNICRVFDYVQSFPCVLLLDEIDAVGIERGSGREVGEMARIVIALMQSLDRIRNETLVIGATNRIDIIDKALLRRFTIQHLVKSLSSIERKAMIEKYLHDVGLTANENEISEFCKADRATAQVVNELIQQIAKSIIEDIPLSLK
jgi:SpoVK/Ycf46/Vps4 family AAA+-type ATPase